MQHRIAVRVRDPQHARIPWAIASHPGTGVVGMIGRPVPKSWKGLVVAADSTDGYGVVVDPDPGEPADLVVTAGSDDRPGIHHASPEGLARALATRVPGSVPAWTEPGKPGRTGRVFPFPAPLGRLRGEGSVVPVEGDLAGAGAFGSDRSLVTVDDVRFLAAATMAAGALVAGIDGIDRAVPVWEVAEDYIAACEDLGLVFAESNG